MLDERFRVDQRDNNPGAGRSSESLVQRFNLQMTPGDIQLTPSEAGIKKILIFILRNVRNNALLEIDVLNYTLYNTLYCILAFKWTDQIFVKNEIFLFPLIK